jgi:hypothetical protein
VVQSDLAKEAHLTTATGSGCNHVQSCMLMESEIEPDWSQQLSNNEHARMTHIRLLLLLAVVVIESNQ